MRRQLVLLSVGIACLLGSGRGTASAEPPGPGAERSVIDEAADRVLDAVKAGDRGALAGLAALDEPDPWLVADALLARGELEAARAFASADARPDVERLPAAVDARARAPATAADAQARAAVAAVLATLEPGTAAQALERLDGVRASAGSIVAAWLAEVRATALSAAARADDAEAAWGRAATAAADLGWRSVEAFARLQFGAFAYRRGDAKAAVERWRAAVAVQEVRKADDDRARLLGNIGRAQELDGDRDGARASYEAALAIWRARDDDGGIADTRLALGGLAARRGDLAAALEAYVEALARAEAGDLADAKARALTALSDLHVARGDRRRAVAHLEQALALLRDRGANDARALGATLRQLGRVRAEDGDRSASSLLFEALEVAGAAGDAEGDRAARIELGAAELRRGDPVAAASWLQAALDAATLAKADDDRARALGYLGAVASSLGSLEKAVRLETEALELLERRGDRAGAAMVLGELTDLHRRLGENGRAEEALRRARVHAAAAGDLTVDAALATHAANLRWSQGRLVEALEGHEDARKRAEAAGLRGAVATAHANVAAVLIELDDLGTAAEELGKARAIVEELGDRGALLVVLVNLAEVRIHAGKPAEALPLLDRALAATEGAKDRAGAAAVQLTRAEAVWRKGSPRDALPLLDRVERDADSLRDDGLLVRTLAVAAQVRLDLKQPEVALEVAKRALPIMERLLRAHGEDEGAIARAQYADLYDAGLRAAVARRDPGQAVRFLESGRAGSLLEALGGRDALASVAVGPELRQADADARAREAAAQRAYVDVLETDDLALQRARRQALDDAQAAVKEVVDRIQRQRKAHPSATLLYPRAATLEGLREWLEPGDALVLYGLTAGDAVAVVVTQDDARCVTLGTTQEVEALRAELRLADETVDPTPTLGRLRALVAAPLALGADVRRVLVAPDGGLAVVPPVLLFPDVPVVFVPSGTTYGTLRDERHLRGEGVLAFGDPTYAASGPNQRARYPGLPGTRNEVEAVGTVKRFGADFTIHGVRAEVAKRPRWRSVLLACHGLVDEVRPWRSALAMTAGADDDGHLLARDVALMRIPADLTVLAACQTGLGKVVRGEGLLGMARAVMAAGSPRVVASLWKVDDAATEAFMVEFYARWNPKDGGAGMPAAKALRAAQEHVRKTNAAWTHPKYWAAWVLWGLPE